MNERECVTTWFPFPSPRANALAQPGMTGRDNALYATLDV